MTDATLTAANMRPLVPSMVMKRQAGEALTYGNAVYLDSNSEWKKTDADAAATAKGLIGIVVASNQEETSVANDEMASVVVFGRVAGFTNLTPGAPYYLDADAGVIADAAGTVRRFIGYAETAEVLFVMPTEEATSA